MSKSVEKSENKVDLGLNEPSICRFCGAGGIARKRMSLIKKQLNEKEKLANEYLSRLQWLQAEFENYKKRNLKEREEFIEFANEGLVSKLLGVMDNLERAVESAKRPGNKEPLIQGLEMIYEQFRDTLNKEGLVPIKAVGEAFDPFKHEAVSRAPSTNYKDGTILEEVQRGYLFKSKVIRPSKVVVVKNPKK